jgi:hypothetical protein
LRSQIKTIKATNPTGSSTVIDIIQGSLGQVLGDLGILLEPIGVDFYNSDYTQKWSTASECRAHTECSCIELLVPLGQMFRANSTTAYDLGLNGFPLRLQGDGSVEAEIEWELNLGIGFHEKKGFYFVIQDGKPLVSLRAEATTESLSTIGTLWVASVSAVQQPHQKINATFEAEIQPLQNRLTLSDFRSKPLLTLMRPSIGVDINIQLHLDLHLANSTGGKMDGFPSVEGDLDVRWSQGLALIANPVPGQVRQLPGTPIIRLLNSGVDLGSLLRKLLVPTLNTVTPLVVPKRN